MTLHQCIYALFATLLYFGLGRLWFSKFAFWNIWLMECGMSEELMQRTPAKIKKRNVIASFFICLLITTSLLTLRSHLKELNFGEWFRVVLVLNGSLMVCGQLRGYLYQKRSLYLFLIEAGYHYIGIMMTASILWFA